MRTEYSIFRTTWLVWGAPTAQEAARARRLRPGRASASRHEVRTQVPAGHRTDAPQRLRPGAFTCRARHPSGMSKQAHALALYRSRSVRAARRVRPSRVSRRARARASPRAVTRRGAPTPHPPGRRLAAPEPGCPPSLTTPLHPNTTGSSRFFSFRSSCATKP